MKKMFEFFKDYCANFVEIQKKHGITENNIEEFNAKMLTYPAYKNGGRFVLVETSVLGMENNTPNTQAMYVPIDEGICDAIIELNKNGYRTEYCCEGHKDQYGQYGEGYIMFEELPQEKLKNLEDSFANLYRNGVMIGFHNNERTFPTIRFNVMQNQDDAHRELLKLILEAAKSLAKPVKERIALAAVHYDDGREDYTFQKAYGVKTGFVVGVFRHPMANDLLYLNPKFKKTMDESTALVTELDYRVTQGFITTTGRFVGRKEAYQIALDAGQINPDDGYGRQLFSEDICPHQAYHTSGKPIER